MLPELPTLPEIQAINSVGLRAGAQMARLPGTVQASEMSQARREAAEKYAQEMKVAFAFTRAADKESKARAKAKGKAAQRIAESR
jgi:hypothetical protein